MSRKSHGMSAGDPWRGIMSCKSHGLSVSDLRRGMVSRKLHVRKKPSVGLELRADGVPHKSEIPGWSAGDMRQ